MSRYGAEDLYRLLPAVYRERDAASGEPLKALVEILAREAQVVEADIARLYESWFIETCDPGVVPYLGDLLGLRPTPSALESPRAEVANTLDYRRRKGTLSLLEQLAHDVTGWPARAVEFFERLATAQYLNHLRPHNRATLALRPAADLERLNGPFETATHNAEVRRIVGRRGTYNIPNIGIFLWRLVAWELSGIEPGQVDDGTGRHFTFDPLGLYATTTPWGRTFDVPLFHAPEAEESVTHLAEEVNVPGPIRRRTLHGDLARYYGAGKSLAVWDLANVSRQPIPAVACDLAKWDREPAPGTVAIDPELGRLAFPAGEPVPQDLSVLYHHGFSADLGGGQYERETSFPDPVEGETTYKVRSVPGFTGPAELMYGTLTDALKAWEIAPPSSAVVLILDSRTYREARPIVLPTGVQLEIRAANGQRPTWILHEPLSVSGEKDSRFELNGLLIAGGAIRTQDRLNRLAIRHATLAPDLKGGGSSLVIDSEDTEVEIERSILGPIASRPTTDLAISDSILDAGSSTKRAYFGVPGHGPASGGALTLVRSTVIGTVQASRLPLAESSLLLGDVTVDFRQQGCVRFCSLPYRSRVPRRYRCQPEIPAGLSQAEADALASRLAPRFTSLIFGHPGYCQLTLATVDAVRRGAEDGSEMGVFSSLGQPLRETSLRARLAEYLRVGLEAELFFVT